VFPDCIHLKSASVKSAKTGHSQFVIKNIIRCHKCYPNFAKSRNGNVTKTTSKRSISKTSDTSTNQIIKKMCSQMKSRQTGVSQTQIL